MASLLFVAAVAAGLCACDGSDKPVGKSDAGRPQAGTARAPAAVATPEQVAQEMRGGVDCKASPPAPTLDATAPVDDVVGVVPGARYDDAAKRVMCTNPLVVLEPDSRAQFVIEPHGAKYRFGFAARFAQARAPLTQAEQMEKMRAESSAQQSFSRVRDVLPGQAKWHVAAMGMPGDEQVLSVYREEWFELERQPPVAAVADLLIAKYGPPTTRSQLGSDLRLVWAYDTLGRRITETSPLYRQCELHAVLNARLTVSPDCGATVAASIEPLSSNAGVAEHLRVRSLNQAFAYERIKATELAFQQQGAAQRAEEVKEASKNAKGPTL
ncbi:hypothetical protein [Tahibacter aquaticus]|nr:hypothetical protein [Tahibacter aquaticus]